MSDTQSVIGSTGVNKQIESMIDEWNNRKAREKD